METSRRGFLAALAAAFVLDPERLLWRPGAKLISIPEPRFIVMDEYADFYDEVMQPVLRKIIETGYRNQPSFMAHPNRVPPYKSLRSPM